MAFNKFMREYAAKSSGPLLGGTPQDTEPLSEGDGGPVFQGLTIENLITQTSDKLRQWRGNHFCYVDGVAICASCLEAFEKVYDEYGQEPVPGLPAYCGPCLDLARENERREP
jgi:hypothetical protein